MIQKTFIKNIELSLKEGVSIMEALKEIEEASDILKYYPDRGRKASVVINISGIEDNA